MDRETINQMRMEWSAEHEKIEDLIRKAEEEKARAVVELQNLEASFPELLTDCFLGKVKKSEVVRIKKQIADLNETIKDLPKVIGILKRDELRHRHQSKPINRLDRILKEYEDQKAKILENPDFRYRNRWEEELLIMSKNPDLDCETDAQEFLSNLKK
jgi:hypothetical protein